MYQSSVIFGCGDPVWAKRDSSGLGTGRLDVDLWELEADAPPALSISEELDGGPGAGLQKPPEELRLEVRRVRADGAAVVLYSFEFIAERLAQIVAQDEGLAEPGVLVTPYSWTESNRGLTFLRPFSQRGWRWKALETVLSDTFGPERRLVCGGKIWLRLVRNAQSVVLPNGAEASYGISVAESVMSRILQLVDSGVAQQWWSDEALETHWFTRQKIVHRINEALRDGARSVELARPGWPLFAFSSEEKARELQELQGLHVTLELPNLSPAPWWEQIAETGFLKSASRPLAFDFDWGAGETLLLGRLHDGSAPEPLQALQTYLRFNGHPFRISDFASLDKALEGSLDLATVLREAGNDLDRRGGAPRLSAPSFEIAPAELGEEAPPLILPTILPSIPPQLARSAPALVTSFSYDARTFVIGEDHHSDFVRVFIDDVRLPSGNLEQVTRRKGEATYCIGGTPAPRGAVVRVEFDPAE